MNNSHAELIRSAANGDLEALDQLARIYGPICWRTARGLGLSAHDAEDVAQNVLIKLVNMLNRYDPERAQLRTLAYRMTVNAAADVQARASAREIPCEQESFSSIPDAQTQNGLETTADSETVAAVRAAATTLPEKQRRVFALHDLEGLSIAETAEALSVSPANVRVHLCLARKSLREKLARFLED